MKFVTRKGVLKLKEIDTRDIQTFIRQKSEKLSAASVRKIYAIIKPSLELALGERILIFNPANKMIILPVRAIA